MSWLRRLFGSEPATPSAMLTANGLLRPEGVMAQFVALRIAALPADRNKCGLTVYSFPLGAEHTLEVRYGQGIRRQGYIDTMGHSVTANVTGPPKCRSLELSWEDQDLIGEQIKAYHARCKAVYEHEASCDSQDAALFALEHLL